MTDKNQSNLERELLNKGFDDANLYNSIILYPSVGAPKFHGYILFGLENCSKDKIFEDISSFRARVSLLREKLTSLKDIYGKERISNTDFEINAAAREREISSIEEYYKKN
ncbi:MAG: hypothetical protein AABW50_04515 [Nanoarchaeota archaeon]